VSGSVFYAFPVVFAAAGELVELSELRSLLLLMILFQEYTRRFVC
jgi:hypothetical protein